MTPLLLARILPAVALLPLGTLPMRLLLGVGAALFLGPHVSGFVDVSADFTVIAVLTEVALGAALGLLASLPLHAASALEANGPLGFFGTTAAWSVFFAVGGPVLWLVALGKSFAAVPPVFAAEALITGGGGLFTTALLLGLPAWLTALVLGPLAGLADRLGLAAHSGPLLALRPFITLLVLIAMLPLLLDVLRDLWLEALRG